MSTLRRNRRLHDCALEGGRGGETPCSAGGSRSFLGPVRLEAPIEDGHAMLGPTLQSIDSTTATSLSPKLILESLARTEGTAVIHCDSLLSEGVALQVGNTASVPAKERQRPASRREEGETAGTHILVRRLVARRPSLSSPSTSARECCEKFDERCQYEGRKEREGPERTSAFPNPPPHGSPRPPPPPTRAPRSSPTHRLREMRLDVVARDHALAQAQAALPPFLVVHGEDRDGVALLER